MHVIIFCVLFVLFPRTEGTKSVCCEEIKSLLKNKTIAYQTVCLGADSRLSRNCCRNIEIELEKHRYAYKTLCPVAEPHPTPIIPTTSVTLCSNTPLGIENGSIPDFAMMSSTALNADSLPHFGRLKSKQGNCAWIPANNADRNSSWLQVDLGRLTNVSAIATQGSCSSDQWTNTYVILYSENGVDWTTYRELGRVKLFNGNSNRNSTVTNHFKSPIVARYLRIVPKSWNENAALRIELYSCQESFRTWPIAKPRSCLDLQRNGLTTNGYYSIYGSNSQQVSVYCDMTSEAGKAWTLVMSYATKNFNIKQFTETTLFVDAPVDKSFPNWNRYRMSLTQMNDLSSQSTHWRATCSFPTHSVDYVDYVRGTFADFDVINYQGGGDCKRMEYLNIRGYKCSQCSAGWYQYDGANVHIDTSGARCGFDASHGAVSSENNFGFYLDGYNSNFRCTANPSATTNWWFGGNVS